MYTYISSLCIVHYRVKKIRIILLYMAIVLPPSSLMSTIVTLIAPSVTLAALSSAATSMVSLKFSSNSLLLSFMMRMDMTIEGIGSLSSVGPNVYEVGKKL